MKDVFYFLSVAPLLREEALFRRAFSSVADADRRQRIERIRSPRERCLSLGGTLLLQKALRDAGAEGAALAYGEHGKPYLAHRSSPRFNLSHSGDYAVCVLSEAPVGCDIERVRDVPPGVAARCFSPEENAALAACADPAEREALFFRFWTLKESLLKAVGCGISLPLSSVSFDLSGSEPAVRQQIAPGPFFFREYGKLPGYRVALCRQKDGSFPPLLPLDWTQTL